MNFKTYKWDDLDNIIFELMNNKVIVVPTDTVTGILSKNQNLIYKIKNRPQNKKIIKFISSVEYIRNLNDIQKSFLQTFWPGKLTIIKDNVSYRMPNDNNLLYILSKFDYLYCSSANLSNQNVISQPIEANNHFNIKKYFYNLVVVDEYQNNDSLPSTIIDIDKWKIIRSGPLDVEIMQWINNNINERNIYLLVDESKLKEFKTLFNYKKDKIHLLKLNEKNFINCIHKINNKSDLLLATFEPNKWDTQANKIRGIRSGIVYTDELAKLIKLHDDTNVAIFDFNLFSFNEIYIQIQKYLNTNFEGGRHSERVNTIIEYENNN